MKITYFCITISFELSQVFIRLSSFMSKSIIRKQFDMLYRFFREYIMCRIKQISKVLLVKIVVGITMNTRKKVEICFIYELITEATIFFIIL